MARAGETAPWRGLFVVSGSWARALTTICTGNGAEMVQKWCRNGEAATGLPCLLDCRTTGLRDYEVVGRQGRESGSWTHCDTSPLVPLPRRRRAFGGQADRGGEEAESAAGFPPPFGPDVQACKRDKPVFAGVLLFWKRDTRWVCHACKSGFEAMSAGLGTLARLAKRSARVHRKLSGLVNCSDVHRVCYAVTLALATDVECAMAAP